MLNIHTSKMDNALKYLDTIHDNKEWVLCEIYRIVNTTEDKSYIGQTVTHRMNHKRYRPYGYQRRLKTHISAALCVVKGNHCPLLMNAIRKYGQDCFQVELLERCLPEDADRLEKEYIKKYNSLYPFGYNVTDGGKASVSREYNITYEVVPTDYVPQSKTALRSEETKTKISASNKKYAEEHREDEDFHFKKIKYARNGKKLEAFKGVQLNEPLDQYIKSRSHGTRQFAYVQVGDKITTFDSQFEEFEESKKRALEFLQQVRDMN